MAETKGISKAAESSNIDKFIVTSNKDQSKQVDLSPGITDLYYYESILQETVKVQIMYIDTGNSVESNGSKKTVLEGLPVVGQENVSLSMTDNFDNKLKLELYVNSVTPLHDDSRKGMVTLEMVSKEYILNEQTRLNVRFDGKVSDHVKKIMTDTKFLNSKKKLDIEETENTYNFVGNNKKPFYSCTWLSKKAVPSIPSSKGKTAGYFFFETSEGFKFRSIDKLLDGKPVKKLYYSDTPDDRGEQLQPGYDGKIVEMQTDNTIDVKSKLEMGAYSTRIILFDPFNCFYEVVKPNSADTEKSLKLAGKELPVFNKEFNKGKSDNFSRTTYMIIDKGTLPTGDVKQQIEEKSQEQNFDPKNILNQSTMRYNQLFTVRKTITIPGDFSLHAGDTIFIDSPEIAEKSTKEPSTEFSGIYMIADLCHYITPRKTFTKLNLVRDSYGRKAPSTIPL
jgi:hypothetical protein